MKVRGMVHALAGVPARRAFLGGAAAVVGLPWLESLAGAGRRARAAGPVQRLLFFYVPNGFHMPAWRPAGTGAAFALSPTLASLEPHKAKLTVITGLANMPAKPDGPGDHASGTGAILTCAHPKKTEGADIQNGISIDQVAASALGKTDRFPSLQLGIDGGASTGGCDSGYSCAYARNISWSGPQTPLAKQTNPWQVFDRLFAGIDVAASGADAERRRKLRRSVLDFAIDDARRLQARLAGKDRVKLDEYLTGVRDLERRLDQAAATTGCVVPARPGGNGATMPYVDHVRTMCDLMTLAFQCQATRVITFMLGNAASGRSYDFLGVSGAHHEISHHQSLQANFDKLKVIDRWEIEQFAYLLSRMQAVDEGGTTLLDNAQVFLSSEITDGDRHNHDDMPVLLAGRGGGAIRGGQHVQVASRTPLANLYLAMLAAAGAPHARFGDSTGVLGGLA